MNKRKFEHSVYSRPRDEKGYLQPVPLPLDIQKSLERICVERVGAANAKEEEKKIRSKASSLVVEIKTSDPLNNFTTADMLILIVQQNAQCENDRSAPLDFYKHSIRGNTHLVRICAIDESKERNVGNVKLVCWRPLTLTAEQQSQLRKIVSTNYGLTDEKEITRCVNNLRKIIRQRIKSAKRPGKEARDQRLGVAEIDIHWGLVTFIAQSGRCYYSQRILRIIPSAANKEDLISKERLDPSLGYTKKNTVWCAVQYNGPQQFSQELGQAFKHGESKSVLKEDLEKVALILKKTVRSNATIKSRQARDDGKWLCKTCQDWKNAEEFYLMGKEGKKKPYLFCKNCTKSQQNKTFSELPGFFPVLMSFCTSHLKVKQKNSFSIDKKRIEKGLASLPCSPDAFVVTIDKNWFVNQFIQVQKGRCAISHHPLDIKRGSPFSVSVERLDEKVGYKPENCVLICNFFQNGQCQWNRDMFERNFLT